MGNSLISHNKFETESNFYLCHTITQPELDAKSLISHEFILEEISNKPSISEQAVFSCRKRTPYIMKACNNSCLACNTLKNIRFSLCIELMHSSEMQI